MNFMHGRLDDGELDLGAIRIRLPDRLKRVLARQSGDVIIGVRPEDFQLDAGGGEGLDALVRITEQLGPETLAHSPWTAFASPISAIAPPRVRSAHERAQRKPYRPPRPEHGCARRHARPVTPNVDRLRLFDPESGDALVSAS